MKNAEFKMLIIAKNELRILKGQYIQLGIYADHIDRRRTVEKSK